MIGNTVTRVVLICSFLVLLTVACQQADNDAESPLPQMATATPTLRGAGETLRIHYWQAPETLNPHLTRNIKDWDASRITYEPLASFDGAGNLVPFLAAEIPSLENGGVAADSRSVTWKLRDDVRWSDGLPFTGRDVRFTYDFIRGLQDSPSAAAYSDVADVIVVDDHTVRVEFTDVTPDWAAPFVGIQGMILPEHVFARPQNRNVESAEANRMPVGTGPYRVVSFEPQEVLLLGDEMVNTVRIIYEANSRFREDDKPYFSRIELFGGGTPEEALRLVAQAGDVDYAWNIQITSADIERIEQLGNARIILNLGPKVERIQLNQSDPNTVTADGERSNKDIPHPIFGDERVREALTLAIDREAIAQLYLGQPTANILASPTQFASPNTEIRFDPDEARDLLQQAGWVDGDGNGVRENSDGESLRIVYRTTTSLTRTQVQQIVKENLEAVGFEVVLERSAPSVFFDRDPANTRNVSHFYADFQQFFDGNISPDPTSYMETWHSSEIPQQSNDWSGSNYERWQNETYDALLAEVAETVEPDRRAELFIAMNDLLVEEVVVIPLVNLALAAGVSTDLVGIDPTPWDADTWNIKDWELVTP